MPEQTTAVKPVRDNTWEVSGDLTVHGTTKPVTLHVDFDGGLETGGILVGKSALIELAVQAIANSKAPVA